MLLLLLLLVIENVRLRLEYQAVWGLELLLLPLLPILILVPVIPSHIILICEKLILELLLLLLLILKELLLHIPLLLLLPVWIIINILKGAKSNRIIILVNSEVLKLILRILALTVLLLGEPLEHLGLVFELRSYSVDLLVLESQLLATLDRAAALHAHVGIHHHCGLKPGCSVVFEFNCELFLRIRNIILVEIVVEIVARILGIVHLLELELILVLLIVILLLLLVK